MHELSLLFPVPPVPRLEKNGGQAVHRVGVDAALGAVDLFDIFSVDDLGGRALGV